MYALSSIQDTMHSKRFYRLLFSLPDVDPAEISDCDLTPEQRLWLAVLYTGIRETFVEQDCNALEWYADTEDDTPGSITWICEELNIDLNRLKRRIDEEQPSFFGKRLYRVKIV